MKKILIALGFTFAAMSAQAALVYTHGGTTISTNDINNITGDAVGTSYNFGTLSADVGDTIQFQNVSGSAEAAFKNFFINDTAMFQNKSNVGTFTYTVLASGPLSFSFRDGATPSQEFFNGSSNIAVLATATGFRLLFNDSGNGDDFDDHAIDVSAVPVPAALPLMASALGIFGLARRNKAKKA